MSLELVVTDAGRAALINAANTGMTPVTITQIGLSATAVTPTADKTSLSGEFKRITSFGGGATADDALHVSLRDDSGDAYTLRSFALYLSDGTLFAIYGQSTAILNKTSSSTALIALDIVFADISAAELVFGATNFTDPDATTTRKGLVRLATTAEARAGTEPSGAVTPATLAAALLDLLLARDGAGSGIDADLLDGQHGAYYANVIARLGYTPLDTAGDTMTGPLILAGDPTGNNHAARKAYVDSLVAASALLTKLLSVDGAGSGLDADLLDGQHGAYYANVIARLGYTPLDSDGGTMTGPLFLDGDPTANNHAARKAYVDGLVSASATLAKLVSVDGTGSGLDADLLDGQHGAYYANVIARLGFTPLDIDGGTMTGPLVLSGDPTASGQATRKAYVDGLVTAAALLTKILTVDGSGSGLDADLLDGQHGAYYANVIARLGFTPLDIDGGTMTGPLVLSGDPTASGHAARKAYVDGLVTAAALLTKILTVDGSGSGLDADLLDGRHANEFLLATDATTFGSNVNGYWEKRANGVIEQWGRTTGSFGEGNNTRTFPIAFTDANSVSVQVIPINATGSTSTSSDVFCQARSVTLTTFTFMMQATDSGSSIGGFMWRAVGI